MEENISAYSDNAGELLDENPFSLDEISDNIERESRRLDSMLLLPQI